MIPELAAGGDTPGGPEEEERYRLFDAVSEVLNDIARHQPVVLVLDDLHWADKPTLLMLRQMVRAADESPLLIVATIRDTERPDGAGGHARAAAPRALLRPDRADAGSTRPTPPC